jgi:branched-chain amino acid transport system substrate-binding protein
MLVVAACGSDDEEGGSTTAGGAGTVAPATQAPADTGGETTVADTAADTTTGDTDASDTTTGDTEASDTTTGDTGASDTTTGGDGPTAAEPVCGEVDDSIDAQYGEGTGRFLSDLACAADSPLEAEGEPIVVGFQNLEGDPNGSFPEFSIAAQAAADYINAELGGLGADLQNGVPGRPIELVVCKAVVSPDDSQRCANELLTEEPAVVLNSINFFGNQLGIYAAAGVPAVVITPVTVGDFTTEGVYSIGGGGGCLGTHTGMVEFATNDLGGRRISVPWADTPPGVVCYYDLEAKPLDVLNGSVEGASEKAGTIPDLEHIGVPIKPATPDVTPQVAEVLDFGPDVIMFSGQGADCWNLVGGLGRAGWTPEDIPLVLSGACIDFDAMREAGDLSKDVYFVGASGALLSPLEAIADPRDKIEATIYQEKGAEYGLPEDQINKGFATQGFIGLMSLWELTSRIVVDGGEVASESISEAYAATDGDHLFGSTPLSCSTAPEPYIAVCNGEVTANQWDGEKLVPVRERFSGVDLVAGTELKPGPG